MFHDKILEKNKNWGDKKRTKSSFLPFSHHQIPQSIPDSKSDRATTVNGQFAAAMMYDANLKFLPIQQDDDNRHNFDHPIHWSKDEPSLWARTPCNFNLNTISSFQIYPEDIVSIWRSCLDSSKLMLDFYAFRDGRRRRMRAQLDLDRPPSGSGYTQETALAAMEEDLKEWIKPPNPPPHQPYSGCQRNVFVILNPFSGKGKALELWQREVAPIWHQAGFRMEIVVTTKAGHATEMARNLELRRIGLLAIGGGDGLVAEVIQGLVAREDSERALLLPLLHLPMGTGNALAASVCFQVDEPFPPRGTFCKQTALMALRPCYRRLRLHKVDFGDERLPERTMFLSLSWGLLADIDICSERFRFLGMIRLHIEAFIRIIRLPSVARYRARITYLPLPAAEESAAAERIEENLWTYADDPREEYGPRHFTEGLVGEPDPGRRFGDPEHGWISGNLQLPPLDEPLPAVSGIEWRTIEDEFCFVMISALSHLGSDLPYLPSARLHDRVLFLSFIRYNQLPSRYRMVEWLLRMSSGYHLSPDWFEVIPVQMCRVEPAAGTDAGMLALDGEAVKRQKLDMAFQVAPTNQCATIASRLSRRSALVEEKRNDVI